MVKNGIDFNCGYLTREEITDFQALVKGVMGKKLTEYEAEDQGTRLIMLIEAFGSPSRVPMSYKDAVENEKKEVKNDYN